MKKDRFVNVYPVAAPYVDPLLHQADEPPLDIELKLGIFGYYKSALAVKDMSKLRGFDYSHNAGPSQVSGKDA